jgi:hypothetical protein
VPQNTVAIVVLILFYLATVLYTTPSTVRLYQSSSGVLRQIKIIYELEKGIPRDAVFGPHWTRLGKSSG